MTVMLVPSRVARMVKDRRVAFSGLVVEKHGIDLGDHQKFAFPFLLGASVVMTIACVLFGVFPL